MPRNHKHTLATLLGICAILLLSIVVAQPVSPEKSATPTVTLFPALAIGGPSAQAALPDAPADAALTRVAVRMSGRIARLQRTSPPLPVLIEALKEQRTLLQNHTTVTLHLPADPISSRTWEVSLQRYPTWLKADLSPASLRFRVDEERISQYLQHEEIEGTVQPRKAVITAIEEESAVPRVVTSTGAARPGIVFDLPTVTRDLRAALTEGTETMDARLFFAEGPVENLSGVPLGTLTLLGTGKSDFKGSPWARIQNVHKAINQQVNNTLVAPGETFSFNATLGGPVTNSNGWYDAKVIFNTNELRMAPGGGICQASTTTFRAMLHAGFSPVKRANHSMYVSYYEKFGVGIDATVFPGKQDLTFVNDTGNYLLFQAYTEGTEAVVQIYGTPDGRTPIVAGPYFASSDLSDFPEGERPPRPNEIAWVHRVAFKDGTEQTQVIRSRYTSLPQTLAQKYTPFLHASGGQEAM